MTCEPWLGVTLATYLLLQDALVTFHSWVPPVPVLGDLMCMSVAVLPKSVSIWTPLFILAFLVHFTCISVIIGSFFFITVKAGRVLTTVIVERGVGPW